jgi:hypothetical protein
MGRPGPRRPYVPLKLSDEGVEWVDQRAREEGFLKGNGKPNRSEMLRLMFAYAQRHMKKGWRP